VDFGAVDRGNSRHHNMLAVRSNAMVKHPGEEQLRQKMYEAIIYYRTTGDSRPANLIIKKLHSIDKGIEAMRQVRMVEPNGL
jgi:hypothetical protein